MFGVFVGLSAAVAKEGVGQFVSDDPSDERDRTAHHGAFEHNRSPGLAGAGRCLAGIGRRFVAVRDVARIERRATATRGCEGEN